MPDLTLPITVADALALAQERPRARVVGTDLSGAAVLVARRTAQRLHLANVEFRAGNWFEPVAGEQFDKFGVGVGTHSDTGMRTIRRDFGRWNVLFCPKRW
jgi:ubiquinone/menaquinone biosynthesis C-methylase UbiE